MTPLSAPQWKAAEERAGIKARINESIAAAKREREAEDASVYNTAIEDAAKVCDGHDAKRDRLAKKRPKYDYFNEALEQSIMDEERGEKIAAELLAKEIRTLKKPVG